MILCTKSFARNFCWALSLLVAAGCASKKPVVKNYIVFPPPPDEPRIQYLTSYGKEDDLAKASKFTRFVLGEEKALRPIYKPYGLAIRDGKIYVCDTQSASVTVADLNKHKFELLKPSGLATMKLPVNVAVDQEGTIYVSDTIRNQLLIYDKQGNLIEALGKKNEMRPCGVALAGDRLYVTDLTNHCVRVYNKATRDLIMTVPRSPGTNEASRLFSPTNVAIDQKGRICVSDSAGFAVKIFDAEGNYLKTIGELGVTPGQFALPKGIGVDREGRIYVVDAAAPVVQLFDADGRLLMYFGEPKSSGEGGLYLPAGLTIDYDNLSFFQQYVAAGFKLEYLILLTNQVGPNKVSVYGFLRKA